MDWPRCLINAGISGGIAAASMLVACPEGELTKAVTISALLAGILSFLVEVKKEQPGDLGKSGMVHRIGIF